MSDLSEKRCVPCQGDVPPLKGPELTKLIEKLASDWKLIDEHHIVKEYTFKNFKEALEFTNIVGKIAETEHHHPDIFLSWGKVKISIFTHKIDGLTESDFVLASKIENAANFK